VGGLFFNHASDNMAIQVGKIAIQVGVAVLELKKALESLNPFVAIAAGVAYCGRNNSEISFKK
jgi:hypothetical protein